MVISLKILEYNINNYNVVLSIWKKTGLSLSFSDEEQEVRRFSEKNPDLFLIGKIKDTVVAVVQGAFDGRRGYVHHLAVDPNYQGKGYGKEIMRELMRRFAQKNVYKVHLFVEKRNIEIIKFYESIGWELRNDLVMMSKYPKDVVSY